MKTRLRYQSGRRLASRFAASKRDMESGRAFLAGGALVQQRVPET